jgi:ANTAR domain-containing protein
MNGSLQAGEPGRETAAETVIAQLRQALQTREVIGQAKGILMARHGLSSDGAWNVLNRTSQDHNVKLVNLARALSELVGGAEPTDAVAAEVAGERLLAARSIRTTSGPIEHRAVDLGDELAAKRGQHADERRRELSPQVERPRDQPRLDA